MAAAVETSFFIFTADKTVEKRGGFLCFERTLRSAARGSLWISERKGVERRKVGGGSSDEVLLRSAEKNRGRRLTCDAEDVQKLDEIEFQLLLALPTCEERFDICVGQSARFKQICALGRLHLQSGSAGDVVVEVRCKKDGTDGVLELKDIDSDAARKVHGTSFIDETGEDETFRGTIKYIGTLIDRKGFWFKIAVSFVVTCKVKDK